MADSVSDAVNKVAAAILTVMGLVAVPFQVATWLESAIAGWVTSAGISLLLGVPAARLLLPTRVQRRFGIRRYKTEPIMMSSVEKVAIAADFTATIETTQTLLFREQPAPDDLVDLIDVLPHLEISENSYSTPDSEITDVVRRSPSTLAIKWRPSTPIVLFAPLEHRTRYQTPALYGDDAFYQAMYVDRDTGVKDWTFVCAHPVERAMAFVMPRIGARVTERYLYGRYVRGDARGCEQPKILDDGSRITWMLANPQKGRTYVLFAVYQGMGSRVLARELELRFGSRVVAVSKRLLRRGGLS